MVLYWKFAIFLTVLPSVLGIKCFECESDTDPKCTDPFDNSTVYITDCSRVKGLLHLPGIMSTMCRKIRQKVNGEWRTSRGCAFLGEVGIQEDEKFCLTRTGSDSILTEYCTCSSKDACNSSIKSYPIPMSIGLLMTLPYAVYKAVF